MDVVNGKIVSARTERPRSDIWRALKPSRGLLQEGAGPCPQAGKPAAGSCLRGGYSSLPVVPGAAAFDQTGWKWSSAEWSTDQQRPSWERNLHRKWSSCPSSSEFVSREFLDKELDMCESRVSRAVIDRIASTDECVGKVVTLPLTSVTPADVVTSDAPLRSGGAPAENPLKRPHSKIDQVAGPWIAPLRYVLRKVMSVSDVGELGRIVLPKKDAEGQLPSIDIKGKQLEMKDYSFSKSWSFHYRWWVNNKSRMYVLENTGGFIKYHGLEANDTFFVYEDGCGNLVARGQKKLMWNPQLDALVTNSESGPSDDKNSKSEKRSKSTEDESCCFNCTTPLSASALD